MPETVWTGEVGNGPIIGAAIHNGHELRDEVERSLVLPEEDHGPADCMVSGQEMTLRGW